MTPDEVKAARLALGFKNAAAFGRALQLEGRDVGRTVRRWESGETIPGIAIVAISLMLRLQALEKAQDAARLLSATTPAPTPPDTAHAVALALAADRQRRAAEGMPPAPRALTELLQIPQSPSRRRGR